MHNDVTRRCRKQSAAYKRSIPDRVGEQLPAVRRGGYSAVRSTGRRASRWAAPLSVRPVPKSFRVCVDRGGDHSVYLPRSRALVGGRVVAEAPVLLQRRIMTLALRGSRSIGAAIGERDWPQHRSFLGRLTDPPAKP